MFPHDIAIMATKRSDEAKANINRVKYRTARRFAALTTARAISDPQIRADALKAIKLVLKCHDPDVNAAYFSSPEFNEQLPHLMEKVGRANWERIEHETHVMSDELLHSRPPGFENSATEHAINWANTIVNKAATELRDEGY